ncbi:MAG: serine hydrolase [Bacteroidota bacterium]|jgi:beta-lactamase class A|nr:serine hydrolase [Chitinophagaceae bacterium]MCA6496231.1 serine hydrolase [Chitinophagaceae bacterium]MCA6513002.1 serine hydrolase [Chitinophagaceae bacterium]
MRKIFLLTVMTVSLGVQAQDIPPGKQQLVAQIREWLNRQPGTYALAVKHLPDGDTILINEKEMFHAASTMKTPVMIEIFRQAAEGKIGLDDTLLVQNEFASIVDGSSYQLSPADDSDDEVYQKMGTHPTIRYLLFRMITRSSNLATNLLMKLADGKQVTTTMRSLGAPTIQVMRGVEDTKAYRQGLNNVTSAYDQMKIYEQIALGQAVNGDASKKMIEILVQQFYRDIIPVQLPSGTPVAHKTGWITGVFHDAGIILLPNGGKLVLVLLSKGATDEGATKLALSTVAALVYNYYKG